ncbi:MAG: carbon-nitrogen hydrolase family protein [Phaeodactylibacter sp.]|nr:carbon-nitrogen hydrolase family protein [Phaeodactylibacter sp.]
MPTTKIALIQAASVLFNLEATIEKAAGLAREAAENGAQLILFPEAFIGGYPRGLSFGTVVGSRSPEGREQWLAYFRNALVMGSPAAERLGAIARDNGAYLAIGAVERDAQGNTLYCSLLVFSPQGELLLRHRKLKPTAAERIIWGEGDGTGLRVLDTPLGRVGGLICWENYMPLARMALYQQNVQLYLAPTADQRDSWQATLRHIACEGRCYVLGCNQFVTREMYPEPYRKELQGLPEVLCRGGSAVVGPLGEVAAGPLWGEEGILYADISLEEVVKSKLDFDVVGHYRWRGGGRE